MKTLLTTLAVAATLSFGTSDAASVIVLGGAPTVNGADIANLNVGALSGGDILNGDRQHSGTTFTTGSNATGYTLTSLTFYQTRATTSTGGRFKFRLGTISGSTFTSIYADETADEANNAYTLSGSGNDWIQYTLTIAQTLAANTTYAVDLGRGDGGNYITWGHTANTEYSGGQVYRSGGQYNAGPGTTASTVNADKLFHLDIAANAIPEPSSAILGALGAILLLRRRR